MNVESAQFTIDGQIEATIDGIRAFVPDAPGNLHREAIAIWEAEGNTIVPYQPPAPTGADINAERTRRIVAGKVINGMHVTGREEDERNLTNLALAAQIRIVGGDTATLTTFRDGDNVDHDLTPPQMLALWQAAAAYVSDLYAASWALKAIDPIPADFADNSYWPAA